MVDFAFSIRLNEKFQIRVIMDSKGKTFVPLEHTNYTLSELLLKSHMWTVVYDRSTLEIRFYVDATHIGTGTLSAAPFGGAPTFGPDGIPTLFWGPCA